MSTVSLLGPGDGQRLWLKCFALSSATCVLAFLLVLVAAVIGHSRAPVRSLLLSGALMLFCQLVFFLLLGRERHSAAKDPGQLESQILVGLAWLTYCLADLSNVARSGLLLLYLPILLSGSLQLRPWGLVRCIGFAFLSFSALVLWDASQGRKEALEAAALQLPALGGGLLWLGLFRGHVLAKHRWAGRGGETLPLQSRSQHEMMHRPEDLMATDDLTGLYNRLHFMRLAKSVRDSMSADCQHGLALIDLDYFKRLNDQYGHAAGDRVLQTFAVTAQACLRENDVLARYGGEEFVLLLLNVDVDRIAVCCERLREAFASAHPMGIPSGKLSLSVGMTPLRYDDTLESALFRAERALHRAKRNGRNRCEASWTSAGA